MSDENDTQEDVSELRKAAAIGKTAAKEAELARRELAFVKAGVNTDTKAGQAMIANYSGELNAEAILAEAKEWGLAPSAAPAPASEEDPEKLQIISEAQAAQSLRDAAAGAPAPNTPPEVGGVDAAFAEYLKEKDAGMSQLDATNRAFGRVIQAAAAGDKQAIFDPLEWEKKAAQHGHGAEFAR